jgi:hypothetical protein
VWSTGKDNGAPFAGTGLLGLSSTFVVILNFSDEPAEFRLPASFKPKSVVVINVPQSKLILSSTVTLLP